MLIHQLVIMIDHCYIGKLHDVTVTIVPEKPKEMNVKMVPPESLRSDIWIDEVLIVKSRASGNIYHNMEPINNLLHCTSISNGCPRVFMI